METTITPQEIAVGGKGTRKIKGPATITGKIAALKLHTDCPGLVLHRELRAGEVAFGAPTNVTTDHFHGGADKETDDFVLGGNHIFGQIIIGADEVITVIKANFENLTIV